MGCSSMHLCLLVALMVIQRIRAVQAQVMQPPAVPHAWWRTLGLRTAYRAVQELRLLTCEELVAEHDHAAATQRAWHAGELHVGGVDGPGVRLVCLLC